MTQVRRQHSKQVKFQAAMEGEKTIQQISQTYAVHQSVLMRTPSEDQTAELHRKVGQFTMEIDFFAMFLPEHPLSIRSQCSLLEICRSGAYYCPQAARN